MLKRLTGICVLLALTCVLARAEGRSRYTIDATLDGQTGRLETVTTVRFVNDSEDVWEQVCFNDYIPAVQEHVQPGAYEERVLSVSDAGTGKALPFTADRNACLICVTPPAPLAPGEEMALTIACEADVPVAEEERFQVSSFDHRDGVTFKLCQFFPILCIWEDGAWTSHPYDFVGEAFYSVCADYSVTLRLPAELTVIASGREECVSSEEGGEAVWSIEAQNMRDLVILASSEYVEPYTGEAGGVTVRCFGTRNQRGQAKNMLQYALDSVALFEELYGEYPYDQLDLCVTRMQTNAIGIEYPGLIEIWETVNHTRNRLGVLVSHEVAHQWFYGVVGNDQYEEPFLDESFAQFSQCVYMDKTLNWSRDSMARYVRVDAPLLPVDLTLGDYHALGGDDYAKTYYNAVYLHGRTFLWEVKDAMGEDAFFEMVRAWYRENAFGVATIDGFISFLREHARGVPEVETLLGTYFKRCAAK